MHRIYYLCWISLLAFILNSANAQMDTLVTFNSSEEDITLTGTITQPSEGSIISAVVLLPVAGPTDRDLTLGNHKYFKTLADSLAAKGIASLRYDDRGTGESTGEFLQTSLETRTADACSALNVLQINFPSVAKVGFIGMSEGAGISILADHLCGPVSFLVLLSAPVREGAVEMKDQMMRLLESGSFSDENKGKIREQALYFLSLVSAENPEENKEKLLELFKGPYGNIVLPPYGFVPKDPLAKTDFVLSPWYQSQIHYNIQEKLKNCNTPTLALYGNLDKAIDAAANAVMVKENALGFNLEMVEGINHLMQEANSGWPMEYVFLPTSFSPMIIDKIISWVKQQ